MEDFIFLALKGAVGVAKRSTHGNRKLSFDYAIRCIMEEMKRRGRYDLYMQARRIHFISAQRPTAQAVVEYFGFSWDDVAKVKVEPPSSNTGVTPSQLTINVSRETEEYINGSK